jgi:anthranilate phosphoribosyltransferase
MSGSAGVGEDYLAALRDKRNWTAGEMKRFMAELMAGRLDEAAVVSALEGLRAKGETALEITEAARAMRAAAVHVQTGFEKVLDTCGTGGDGGCTVNVSTLVSLIAAAAGVPVAKHGNRAVSGVCGSADFLSAIGIPLEVAPEKLLAGLRATDFAFFYAPSFHPSMKHAAAARKKISGRTMFNCLGPLANPAGATHQVVGVYEARLVELVAGALAALGSEHAVVVHGEDGLDEVSPCAPTRVVEWTKARGEAEGRFERYLFTPEEAGLSRVTRDEIRSANAGEAVRDGLAIIDGAKGPKTNLVVLNAGFALKAANLVTTPADGARLAEKLLQNGAVRRKMDQIKAFYA